MKMRFLLALLLVVASAGPARAQSPEHPVRTIHRLITDHDIEANRNVDFVITADPFPSRTIVVFTGEKRAVDKARVEFVSLWFETRGKPRSDSKAFENEYQLKEGDVVYWLPVLKELEPYMDKELRKGDLIELYYFFMGGYSKSSRQWVFAVEEFRKL